MIKVKIKKRLKEEKIADKFYYYHATITKPNLSFLHSFRNGIRTDLSQGMAKDQGAGFYLFGTKKQAIDRANSDMLFNSGGSNYQPFNKQRDGYKLIITIESENLDPAKFSIDNELSTAVFTEIINKNFEQLSRLELGGTEGHRPKKFGVTKDSTGRALIIRYPSETEATGVRMKSLKIDNDNEGDQGSSLAISGFLNLLADKHPSIYADIQTKMLNHANANVIKYIGKEVLKPYKLEIIDDSGKLIDVTTRDPQAF